MGIQKGDEVRFLNDIGGGIVTRIVGDTAYVEDADGFEIPAKLTQVVLVKKSEKNRDDNNKASNLSTASKPKAVKFQAAENQIYIAFLQAEKPIRTMGDVRLAIVNSTPYNIFVALSISTKREGQFDFLLQQQIDANQLEVVDKFPSKIFDGQTILVQAISYQTGVSFAPVAPVSNEIKIRSSRLLKEGSYVSNGYFDEGAILCPVIKNPLDEKIELLQEKMRPDQSPQVKTVTKKLPKPGDIIEIDLHINELLDNTQGLTSSEMLKIQLDKFNQSIDLYRNVKGLKLVFIHGVGNGVLKQAIIKLLNSTYKGLYFQDASFKEYGYGATMVIL